MATIKTEVSVGEWEDRAGLVYVPANDPVPGVGFVDAFGRAQGCAGYGLPVTRRPYRTETAEGVTYIQYDAGKAPIFRVTELEA